MGCEYICDGCGKRAPGIFYPGNPAAGFQKPGLWFERGDKDGIQEACSRECITKIAEKTNKTGVILPF